MRRRHVTHGESDRMHTVVLLGVKVRSDAKIGQWIWSSARLDSEVSQTIGLNAASRTGWWHQHGSYRPWYRWSFSDSLLTLNCQRVSIVTISQMQWMARKNSQENCQYELDHTQNSVDRNLTASGLKHPTCTCTCTAQCVYVQVHKQCRTWGSIANCACAVYANIEWLHQKPKV